MKKIEYVYYNSRLLGYIKNNQCTLFQEQEKQNFLNQLEKTIIKKERFRKISSLSIGLCMLIVAITLALLMIFKVITLGSSQWFNYTFVLVGLVFLWVLLYFLLGLLFYRSIPLQIHFKNNKANSCVTYASSNYCKYVNQYYQYIGKTQFNIKVNQKRHPVSLALKQPSIMKNIIHNGHVKCNIPYFYMINGAQRVLFLPGIVMIMNGKYSKVISTSDLKVKMIHNHYDLYIKEDLFLSFNCNGEFNGNFFYFKYEQF